MNESQLQLHGPVSVRKYGRAPLYVAAAIFAVALIIGMWQMGLLEDRRAPKPVAETPAPDTSTRERPLVQADGDVHGVLGAVEPEADSKEELPPIQVVVQTPVDPAAELYRRQVEELRKQRAEAALAARSAPLGVHRGEAAAPGPDGLPSASPASSASRSDTPGQRDDTDRKEEFLGRADAGDDWQSPYTRQPGRPYELKTGTVIPGVLLTGIHSDLPGNIIGQVAQDVYDSATGRWLLVPRGARLYGVYDSRVAMGQRRVLIAWNRIIFPDGSSVSLGAMPGASPNGMAGFQDQVNNHYLRIFGSGVLMSLISGGMAYSMDRLDDSNGSDDKPSLQNEMGSALASQLGQTSMQLLQQHMSVSPTLEVRSGYLFQVVLTKDLAFEVPYAG